MDCAHGHNIDRIVCAIQNQPLDWPNIISTIAAALLGAGIGAIALLLVFRAERNERRRESEAPNARAHVSRALPAGIQSVPPHWA